MYRHVVASLFAACIAGLATVAFAQGQPPGTVTVSGAATGLYQFDGGLARGGDVRWSDLSASGSVTRQFVPAFAAGLALRYDVQDWRFDAGEGPEGRGPWGRLQRPGVGLNLSLALSRTLLVGVSPSLDWAYDSAADPGDALIYGAVVSAAKVFSPRLVLGAGVNLSRQFYSLKTSPFVIVNWRITDRLRVANAPAAGPEGGAGVELRYTLTPDWEIAGGGVYRSDRYRLDDLGSTAGRVGETSSIPLLARLSRKLGAKSRVDLYAGALVNGRLGLKDSDGGEIATEDYRTAPAVAATLTGRF
jgi:hypothetical protein